MVKQFFSYSFVGAIGTLGHYAVLWMTHEILAIDVLIATTLGFLMGAIINYLLNYFFVFKSDRQHRQAMPRFFSIALVGMLLNYLLMYLFVKSSDYSYWLFQVITTLIVLLLGYSLNKIWTFAQEH